MDFTDQEYRRLARLGIELTNQATEKAIDFYRHLLTVSAGSLGLLTVLHASSAEGLYIRLVYLLVVVTLAIGILTSAIALHGLSMLPERGRQAFFLEVIAASQEERSIQPVFVEKTKLTVYAERYCLVSLSVSLIGIVVYVCLTSF